MTPWAALPLLASILASVPAHAVGAQGLDGVWRSEGYGHVFVIRGSTLQTYEVTQSTCVRTWQAVQDTAQRRAAEAVYRRADNYIFAIYPHDEPASRRLQSDNSASYVVIRRIPQSPAVCQYPTPDTPAGNFEVFTRTWAENYLWDRRQVDWPAVVADARARVTSRTTPRELFDILSGMIRPLEDAHTSIRARSINQTFWGYRSVTERFLGKGFGHYFNVVVP